MTLTTILGVLRIFLWGEHGILELSPFGGFLKWWYPTTMGFPTKNDQFWCVLGYHHFRKHPFGHELSWTGTLTSSFLIALHWVAYFEEETGRKRQVKQ